MKGSEQSILDVAKQCVHPFEGESMSRLVVELH
jgi:hypothetical protein